MPAVRDLPSMIQPFAFLGLDVSVFDTSTKTNCPFCGDEKQKLTIVNETGQFRCVKCDEQGNLYRFLQAVYSTSSDCEEYAETLALEKKLPVHWLLQSGLCSSMIDGSPIVPGYNSRGVLSVIYKLGTIDNKLRALQTPQCKAHAFGSQTILPEHTHIYVVEGLWDWVITKFCLDITGRSKNTGVIGVAGSSNFHKDVAVVANRNKVTIVFDNDHPVMDKKTGKPRLHPDKTLIRPGYDGQVKFANLFAELDSAPRQVAIMNWGEAGGHNPKLPSGFDLRDLFSVIYANDFSYDQLVEYLNSNKASQPLPEFILPADSNIESFDPDIIKAAGVFLHFIDTHCAFYSPQKKADGKEEAPKLQPLACNSFQELIKCLEDNQLVVTQELRMTLQTMLAIVISTEIGGDQLWLRVIGPPSSGKSTLAEALSVCRQYVRPISIMTGLHSGFVADPSKGAESETSSLIPSLAGKTAIVKDGDTLLQNPRLPQILSELRDLYDRTSRAEYRNKMKFEAEGVDSTWIICGTDDLRELNRSSLGERFLDIEIMSRTTNQDSIVRRSQAGTLRKMQLSLNKLRQKHTTGSASNNEADEDHAQNINRTAYGFVLYLKSQLATMQFPDFSDEYLEKVEAVGKLLSFVRARRKKEDSLRPRAEVAARLVNQFTKLAVCLALVSGEKEINDSILSVVRKVGIDSGRSYHQEVITLLYRSSGLDTTQICTTLNLPETSIRNTLEEMQAFEIVSRKGMPNNSHQRGRYRHVWELNPKISTLCELAGWPKPTAQPSKDQQTTSVQPKPQQTRSERVKAQTKAVQSSRPSKSQQTPSVQSLKSQQMESVQSLKSQQMESVQSLKSQQMESVQSPKFLKK